MKYLKKVILIFLILSTAFITSSCWNYKEVEELNIVMGMAVDKDKDHNKYIVTVEVASPKLSEQQSKIQSELYTSEGSTIFDALRNSIIISGKKSFLSHTEVLVISKHIGEEDISRMLDLFSRDSEIRGNLFILISKEKTAKEIFEAGHTQEGLTSDKISNALNTGKSVSKYPIISLGDVVNNFSFEGNSMLLPLVGIKKSENKNSLEVNGSAILKYDKIVGYLNGDETKYALWVKGDLKGGLFIVENIANSKTNITFEIFSNHTNKKTVYYNEKPRIMVDIKPMVSIGEVDGDLNFQDEKEKIKKDAETVLKKRFESIIKKLQNNYKSDIFSFGTTIETSDRKLWKRVKAKWCNNFATLPVEVNVCLNIRDSATKSKPLKGGR
jgi:spore germination protein KC